MYQIIAIILPIIAFIWEKFLRDLLYPFLEQSTLVESYRRRNLFVSRLYHKHIVVTSILLGLSVVFAILSLF